MLKKYIVEHVRAKGLFTEFLQKSIYFSSKNPLTKQLASAHLLLMKFIHKTIRANIYRKYQLGRLLYLNLRQHRSQVCCLLFWNKRNSYHDYIRICYGVLSIGTFETLYCLVKRLHEWPKPSQPAPWKINQRDKTQQTSLSYIWVNSAGQATLNFTVHAISL